MLRRSADARSERLRRYWDKQAPKYDKQVAFFERRLVGDGRQWVCSQATGDVLEVAIGTGRNLPFYPEGIRLTGTDFSPAMLELARRQADQLGRRVDLLPRGRSGAGAARCLLRHGGLHAVAVRHPGRVARRG